MPPFARRGRGRRLGLRQVGLAWLCVAVAAPVVLAEASDDAAARLERLEEQIAVLAEEIADLKAEQAVPEDVDPAAGVHGHGPAASKVYKKDRGLSIGGYAELRLREFIHEDDGKASVYDATRFVLYTGYKWNDWLLFNSELEVEHADTDLNGSVALEFLTVDFLVEDWINFRTGLVLIPMGFLNEVHEPPFYYGAERPEVERSIIPSTWRENGVGIFGDFDLGAGGALGYRFYAVNGFDATGFSSSGLRGGRQKGSKALAEHWAFVGRLDWDLSEFLPGASIGGSVYTGKAGQNQSGIPDALTTIYEVHGSYRGHGLTVRGLVAQAFVDQARGLSLALGLGASSAVAKEMIGGYAEIAYDVLPLFAQDTEMSLEPFFRYEHLDTQYSVPTGFTADRNKKFDLYVVGLHFKPIPQVVLKLDYRDFEAKRGDIADEVQAGVGFVF